MISDKDLIINHTIFFAYFCHLIESDQADTSEELGEIGWKLEEEMVRRKISCAEVEEYLMKANLSPEEKLMIATYIDSDLCEKMEIMKHQEANKCNF